MKKNIIPLILLLASFPQIVFSINPPIQGAGNFFGIDENGTCTITNATNSELEVLLGNSSKGTINPGQTLRFSFANLISTSNNRKLTIKTVKTLDAQTEKSLYINDINIKNNYYFTIKSNNDGGLSK